MLNTDRRKHIWAVIVVVVLTGVAFWVRVRNWPMIFTAEGVRFLGSDTLYHMRRVWMAVHNSLCVPVYDPFLNYPAGLHPNWPPLYDQFMAFIALIAGRGAPDRALVEVVGALTPPVLGALVVPVVYCIARRLMSWPSAIVAAATAVVLPYAIQISVLGRPDHHVAAVLCASLLFLFVMRMLRAETCRRVLIEGAVSGFFLFLCLGVWIGSLILIFILGLTAVISLSLLGRYPERARRLLSGWCMLFALACILFLPVVLTGYFFRAGIVSWDAPSAFHLFILGGTAGGLVAWHSLVTAVCTRGIARWARIGAGSAILALLCVVAWRLGVIRLFASGSEWLMKADPIMARLVESFPLTWQSAGENFTWMFVVFPLVLCWMVLEQTRKGRTVPAVLLVVWTFVLFVLVCRQERFSDLFSVVAALLIGKSFDLMYKCYRWMGASGKTANGAAIRFRWAAGFAVVLYIACVGYAFVPAARWLKGYWRSAPQYSQSGLYHWCLWLRDNTPDPGGLKDADIPHYAVLASWPYGHAITYIGQRPNVANPFVGWSENREANMVPYRFYVEDDPAVAMDILDTYGVRYVVVMESLRSGHFADMLASLNESHDVFFSTQQTANGPVYSPKPRMLQSMIHRLYVNDGEGLSSFRRVYVSPECIQIGNTSIPKFQIWEYLGR